jgi:hypothetical protein
MSTQINVVNGYGIELLESSHHSKLWDPRDWDEVFGVQESINDIVLLYDS